MGSYLPPQCHQTSSLSPSSCRSEVKQQGVDCSNKTMQMPCCYSLPAVTTTVTVAAHNWSKSLLLTPVFFFTSFLLAINNTWSVRIRRIAVQKRMHSSCFFVLKQLNETTLDRSPNENFVPVASNQNLRLRKHIIIYGVHLVNARLHLVILIRHRYETASVRKAVPLNRLTGKRSNHISFLIRR